MNVTIRRLLVWVPRILGILFAAFLGCFALDVFREGYGTWETVAAFLMHLLPTLAVVIALVLAWRWLWLGSLLFLGLGLLYILAAWGRFPWHVYLLISGPAFLIGVLFLVSWLHRAELRPQ